MLTVAAVGKYIIDHWQGPFISEQTIINALLVHDLGNLVKFDLTKNAQVIDPTLLTDDWRKRQVALRKKYGHSSHQATAKIIQELGLPIQIQQLVSNLDAANICNNANDSLTQQICSYADLRVTPKGVASLTERLTDLRERYQAKYSIWKNDAFFAQHNQCAQQIEATLQQYTSTDIINIPSEKIELLLVELAQFEILTN
ncbi:MAG: hypothetical protein ACD_83C00180G0002 [uncultured bacterium]|nr:MAG: hypothetical protein ACD_83C00180G0002 [uncultured bacterium]